MARQHAGDWRDPARVGAWAAELARALPAARPGQATAPPGRALGRLVLHALAGWALCAAVMGGLLATTSLTVALAVHALAVPVIFAGVARHYFRPRGARAPLPTAIAFPAMVALMDLIVVAGLARQGLAMFGSIVGTWLPLLLIFVVTLATGAFTRMQPARAHLRPA